MEQAKQGTVEPVHRMYKNSLHMTMKYTQQSGFIVIVLDLQGGSSDAKEKLMHCFVFLIRVNSSSFLVYT